MKSFKELAKSSPLVARIRIAIIRLEVKAIFFRIKVREVFQRGKRKHLGRKAQRV